MNGGHLGARVRIGLLLFAAILLQTSVGSDLRVGGVAPDVMVLIAVVGGLTGGTEAGAWVGFFAGLLDDLFLTTPLGLSALTLCLVGAAVGALRTNFLPNSRLLTLVAAFVATASAIALLVGAGDVLGQSQLLAAGRSWLLKVAVVESAWSAVLALPVEWIYRRAARGSAGVEKLGSAFTPAALPDRLPMR